MNQSWVQMSAVIGLGLFGHAAGGVPTAENPVELGRVSWHRELDVALEERPELFDGLERPEDVYALAGHREELIERIESEAPPR